MGDTDPETSSEVSSTTNGSGSLATDDTSGSPTSSVDSGTTDETEAGSTVQPETGSTTGDHGQTEFVVRIENSSAGRPLPSPLSAGVWVVHAAGESPIWSLGQNAGEGLTVLSEDGNPGELALELERDGHSSTGVFDRTQVGETAAWIEPGQVFEFTVRAESGDFLSLGSMLGATNDVAWGTPVGGIALFDDFGVPTNRVFSSEIQLYDAGTEAQQPPGAGGYQATAGGVNRGPAESGEISVRSESTRAIPSAGRIVDVTVSLKAETTDFMLQFTNVSGGRRSLVTSLSSIVWCAHDETFSLVTAGLPASAQFETFAESGDTGPLLASVGSLPSVLECGVATGGAFSPGQQRAFDVSPDAEHPFVSFAMMLEESNDAFIATEAVGIRFVEEDGTPRSPSELTDEAARMVYVWDAGTEANESPGAGANTAARQAGANDGEPDPNSAIRYYFDPTNDLSDLAGDIDVSVLADPVDEEIRIILVNDSAGGPFEFSVSAGIAVMTDDGDSLFSVGQPASIGLEMLAEDADPSAFLEEVDLLADALSLETEAFSPGEFANFTLTGVSAERPILHFAAMLYPSNDTIIGFAEGVRVFSDEGDMLSSDEIETLISEALVTYDVGTEQNQAGARGADMYPIQGGGVTDTGAWEGPGQIRIVTRGGAMEFATERVWSYPWPQDFIRLSVSPMREVVERE